MNIFIMRQYYIITKLETVKIGYRRELRDRLINRSVEQMADKRGFDNRNRGLFDSNTGSSHANKKL